jgi:uncharacterized repeat protein (TIGR01451 family)
VVTGTLTGAAASRYTAPANPASEIISATVHNQTVTLTLTIDQVDLQLSKSDGVTETAAGETLTYTLTLTNAGGFPATGVTLTDTLPAPVTFVSASDSGTAANGIVTWPPFTLAAGATTTRTVTVTVNDPLPEGVTSLTNTAEVTDDGSAGPDAAPADNRDTDVDTLAGVTTYTLYLPLVTRNHVTAPDLVVEVIQTCGTPGVVIANRGTAPATDPFWVDLYINPDPAPEAVNEVWQDLGDEGLVWGVTEALAVNETLTLTLNGPYYSETYSQFAGDLPAGTTLYAQVDSAALGRTHGGVQELHEIQGTAYNNILGPVTLPSSCAATLETGASAASGVMIERLPRR